MNVEIGTCWTLGCRNKISDLDAYCTECLVKIKAGTALALSPHGSDEVNNPAHYNSLDARCDNCNETIKCISVMEALPTNLATALKYIWRCEYKGKKQMDIEKAIWYLQRELKRMERVK